MSPTHKVGPLTLTFEKSAPSLAGTGTVYAVAQARVVDGAIRYQCGPSEWTYKATPDICTFLSAQPAPWQSKAKTAAMYTPVLIRAEGPGKMRVQAAGTPGLNRDCGAEWIHEGPCPGVAGAIIAASLPADDAAGVLQAGKVALSAPEPDTEDDDAAEDA